MLVLVVLNGFFAMSELAIVSARRARLETMARAGNRGADAGAPARRGSDRVPLDGADRHHADRHLRRRLSRRDPVEPLAEALRRIPRSPPSPGALAFALVVVATTYVSLIIGELVPKRLALRNAEGIAAFVSGPMTVLAAVGTPIVWFLRLSTEAVLGLLRLRGEAPSAVTEEEVKAMIAEGTDAGVFHEAERDLLEGVIRFADRPLRSIMVPRHAMIWIDANDPLDEAIAEMLASGHSRFPLCDGGDRRGDRLRPRQGHPGDAADAAAATCASWRASRSTSARASRRSG